MAMDGQFPIALYSLVIKSPYFFSETFPTPQPHNLLTHMAAHTVSFFCTDFLALWGVIAQNSIVNIACVSATWGCE